MLKQLPKVLLLLGLLTAFVASSVQAFAGEKVCLCVTGSFKSPHPGGCQFDKKTSQCVNTGCPGLCF